MANYQIEIERNNVTLAQFLRYVKQQCARKGIDAAIGREEFENPTHPDHSRYYVDNGIKRFTYNGYTTEWDAADAACKSEICCTLPYDMQTYILNFNGSMYNEICEFTFDNETHGHGYYYQANRDSE